MVHYINTTKDDDLSSTTNTPRNFVGELMYYKEKEGLLFYICHVWLTFFEINQCIVILRNIMESVKSLKRFN